MGGMVSRHRLPGIDGPCAGPENDAREEAIDLGDIK